ncbi:MAG: hypothetical protein NT075_19225 [Chloroflexi bacterium]|nr:hypothetical protein [Chloroflexota bacterium]
MPATTIADSTVASSPAADPGLLIPRATSVGPVQALPLLAAHEQQMRLALQQPIPILTLQTGLDDNQRKAQELAIQDPRFQADLHDPATGAPLRNEIFGIYPLRESDVISATAACHQNQCLRVELYNYAINLTTLAVVDVTKQTVLTVVKVPYTQPDIPPALTQIALEIATNAPEVAEALGYKPADKDAMMANTKTALNRSRCERSEHLCVAPTFQKGEWALWPIVDLTDGVLVGIRWTAVGSSVPVTEKKLQNDVITKRYCETTTPLARDGWQLDYMLTSSDGLRISNVKFKDKLLIDSAKLVDWHVSYSQRDGFGYSDAVGCPIFSQAAVLAMEPPQVEALQEGNKQVGFVLRQRFFSEGWPNPCNYNYEQRYEFYTDGRFRPVVGSLGRGCGSDGTYRPVTRIAFAGKQIFAARQGNNWQTWAQEGWFRDPTTAPNPNEPPYRIVDAQGHGFYMQPARGQFADGGRGDHAFIYVTRRHPDRDEGDADLVTIGPCCNTDYHQGPEKFIEPTPEALTDSELTLWYVPELKNDGTPGEQYCWAESIPNNGIYTTKTYPCFSGPMFIPTEK